MGIDEEVEHLSFERLMDYALFLMILFTITSFLFYLDSPPSQKQSWENNLYIGVISIPLILILRMLKNKFEEAKTKNEK